MTRMDLELRPILDEEYPAYSRNLEGVFGHVSTDQTVEEWRLLFEPDRSLAVFDAGEVVATAGAFSFDLTLPGGTTTPTAAVTAVGVRSTHRRRGLLTAMMRRQLDDVADRGESVAILTASEGVIYGRFGYGLACSNGFWQLSTAGTVLRHPPRADGRLAVVDAATAAKTIPGVSEQARFRHSGALRRTPGWWERWFLDREPWRDGASARFYVLHTAAAGEVDGFAAYRIKHEPWRHGLAANTLVVDELDATDDEVEAALWQYLIDVDLVATVKAVGRPVDEPLRWRLADPRRLSVTDVIDHLWVRVLDVPRALEARRYATEDRIVLEVSDDFRPETAGRYLVEGGPDGARCRRTDDPADLAMSVVDLGALYLGGASPTVLARAGRIVERTPGALRRADVFFPSAPAPWCSTEF